MYDENDENDLVKIKTMLNNGYLFCVIINANINPEIGSAQYPYSYLNNKDILLPGEVNVEDWMSNKNHANTIITQVVYKKIK